MNAFQINNPFHLIPLLYLLASLIALILRNNHRLSNLISNILCIIAAGIGIIGSINYILSGDHPGQLLNFVTAIPFLTISASIDKLSSFFILGLSILVFSVSLYSLGYTSLYYGRRNVGLFNFLYASFVLSMFLVFVASNAIFFFIAWEIMSLISYFLVIFHWEIKENLRAGILYIIMTHVGASFLLIAFMMMYGLTGNFDIFAQPLLLPLWAKNIMFLLFLIGFGTKGGVIPFHIWLPYAHPAASSNVSALMSGIMIKTAVYGFLRFVLLYLGPGETWWGVLLLVLGIISAVLGVAYALMENNIKKLLAFSSIENMGIILVGLGVGLIASAKGNMFLAGLALIAGLFHTFNHMFFKGGLFLGAGAIQYATHTNDMNLLGGLIRQMPVTAFFVLCFSLAISAIVPFNGFVSEWLVYQSLFAGILQGEPVLNILGIIAVAALAMAGALAAVAFVKLFGISFLGRPRQPLEKALGAEVPLTMQLAMGMLAILSFVFGILPILALGLLDKVVGDMVGPSYVGQVQGGLFFAYYPLEVGGNPINPLALVLVLVILISLTLMGVRLIGGSYREREYGTWDCGFRQLTPRMQYSATGFAKPLRIVFRLIYRPERGLDIEEGPSPYFPLSRQYRVANASVFEQYFYNPLMSIANKISARTGRVIQTGSIHLYLLYILMATIALMLYNRLA